MCYFDVGLCFFIYSRFQVIELVVLLWSGSCGNQRSHLSANRQICLRLHPMQDLISTTRSKPFEHEKEYGQPRCYCLCSFVTAIMYKLPYEEDEVWPRQTSVQPVRESEQPVHLPKIEAEPCWKTKTGSRARGQIKWVSTIPGNLGWGLSRIVPLDLWLNATVGFSSSAT